MHHLRAETKEQLAANGTLTTVPLLPELGAPHTKADHAGFGDDPATADAPAAIDRVFSSYTAATGPFGVHYAVSRALVAERYTQYSVSEGVFPAQPVGRSFGAASIATPYDQPSIAA